MPSTDTSVSSWLEHAPYTIKRKAALLAAFNNTRSVSKKEYLKKLTRVTSFIKDEHYPEYKHARSINSRSDEFKTLVGPIFHQIEKEVFKDPHFIKYVPVKDRAQYILDNVHQDGAHFIATDYSTFEAHFIPYVMKMIEFQLYRYMTQLLADGAIFMDLVESTLAGENNCNFRNVGVKVKGVRMSGEMCTSLGNGFSNLMIMLFTGEELNLESLKGVVEGDDGLFSFYGQVPNEDWFKELGFTIKLESFDKLSNASFCGLLFDETDKQIITDPKKVLNNFAWIAERYSRAKDVAIKKILKCKALSTLYQYSGCPVIHSYVKYMLRAVGKVQWKMGYMSNYEKDWTLQLMKEMKGSWEIYLKDMPKDNTRALFSKLYNVTIEEQLELEKYFDGLNSLIPISHPYLDRFITVDTCDYFCRYCFDFDDENLFYPHVRVPRNTQGKYECKKKSNTKEEEENCSHSQIDTTQDSETDYTSIKNETCW